MNVPATGTLSVDGATLYYELRGSGSPLPMIPGGGCDAGIFDGVAGPLAGGFTVISFDPRGRSRSRARPGRPPAEAVAMISRMHATIDRMQANTDFFLAHELRQFSSFAPDVGALRAVSDRIILATGRESAALLPGRPAAVLAARLGSELAEFPGGHAGYATDPADFAERLAAVLAGAGSADGNP